MQVCSGIGTAAFWPGNGENLKEYGEGKGKPEDDAHGPDIPAGNSRGLNNSARIEKTVQGRSFA